MLIFYIDEFGDHSLTTKPGVSPCQLKDGVSPHFILSAVGVRDTSRKPLAQALFELKRKHFGSAVEDLPWSASELKGRYLFRAARSVASGKTLEKPAAYARLQTVESVASLITDVGLLYSKFRPVIFATAVDKCALLALPAKRRRTAASPLGAAYTYLWQRVALTMERLHAGEGAVLVADQQTQHESFFRSGQMTETRDSISSALGMRPDFNLVLDKPLWVDTELSSWDREILQLADIVAYSTGEYVKRQAVPTEACYLWDALVPHFAINWSTGRLEGGGLSVYPTTGALPGRTTK